MKKGMRRQMRERSRDVGLWIFAYVGTLLGMGGAYGKALLLGPPLLFHSCNGWARHCRCGRKGKFFFFFGLIVSFFFFFWLLVLVF